MRRLSIIAAAGMVAVLCFGVADAITFVPGSKPDPFAPGKICDAPELGSWGSYVYDWPSKYDLIFSPQDYPMWIWRCETSGYISFPPEFDKMSEAEKARIGAYLAEAKFGAKAKAEGASKDLLQHLEKIYALRDLDDGHRGFMLRYFAWQYRDDPLADDYRRKALELYRKRLDAGELKEGALLEGLYILGFYSYKLGHADEAKAYFARLKTTESIDPESKKPIKGAPYLEGLADDVLAGKADDKVRFANN